MTSIPKIDPKRWQPHLQRARREGKSVARIRERAKIPIVDPQHLAK
ncbi:MULTISPECIES: hypothetical protein [Variovorax]|uniref:Uncharacterized protein n=1 Tax=Variovorax ginsengisoli TaxID=363844 RepID=A0ABT8S997_9BURK|nr:MULTISPECIES: hypothetical protein [Variovorax]MDM0042838.1 hypothetical protein [Variovorax sp. J22R193]MDM0054567.1 hypothetical protein [Variovorax sp. J22G47]MDM0064907.1 hypothetical protein [Variovorax sp. J22G21]MDM0122109.1 hypothetical protein [Variovorax sp. J2L1-78]MDN8616188.1 hypothetical protein [Variovorax ginsengisoli]